MHQEHPEPIEESASLLKIGKLAEFTQESIATLRYWTKLGLLEVATTTPSGYHLYAPSMIARCRKIRELQNQRHTLEEIVKAFEEDPR
jgi:DNA-binding transcriptional MerR regulator